MQENPRFAKRVGAVHMNGSFILNTKKWSMKKDLWLLGLILIAFSVRFFGIFHDLPFTYYGDEKHFINRAVAFGSGDLNPHWFHKPALYMYLLFFEYGMYFLVGKLPRGGIVEGGVRITGISDNLLAGAPAIDHVIGCMGELKR